MKRKIEAQRERDKRTRQAKHKNRMLTSMHHSVIRMSQRQDIRNTIDQEVYDQFIMRHEYGLAALWHAHHKDTVDRSRRY